MSTVGFTNGTWLASFQICHTCTEPRNSVTVEPAPYRATAAPAKRAKAAGSAGRQWLVVRHAARRAQGGLYARVAMTFRPRARASRTTVSVLRSQRKLAGPSPWIEFQSKSSAIH